MRQDDDIVVSVELFLPLLFFLSIRGMEMRSNLLKPMPQIWVLPLQSFIYFLSSSGAGNWPRRARPVRPRPTCWWPTFSSLLNEICMDGSCETHIYGICSAVEVLLDTSTSVLSNKLGARTGPWPFLAPGNPSGALPHGIVA